MVVAHDAGRVERVGIIVSLAPTGGADDAALVKPKAVVVVRPEARGRLAADPDALAAELQAHVQARGVDQGVRAIGQQASPVRKLRLRDGVVGRIVAVAPAVEDQQQYGLGSRHP